MQYADEKITSLKMEQREQQTPMSLDDGYYINGQLEKFKKAELFDKQVIVFLPESFVDMPEQISILKYPYLSRPQILMQVVNKAHQIPPILLIDEYDQPIMSSYEHGYHNQIGDWRGKLMRENEMKKQESDKKETCYVVYDSICDL